MDLSLYTILVLSLGALGFGMYLLAKGGDWTVEAAVYIADRFGVPKLLIGFTIVAIGTSLPELVVSLDAHLGGRSAVALGNVVGSNIANILLILAATTLVWPVTAKRRSVLADLTVMMLATLFVIGLLLFDGGIARWQGGLMLAVLIAYIALQFRLSGRRAEALFEEMAPPAFRSGLAALAILLCGLVALAFGAEFLIEGASTAARVVGVPEAVVGLTVVALGTSLPELATCIAAARQHQTDVVVGNIIGSNVFNLLFILGTTAAVKAMPSLLTGAELAALFAVSAAAAVWLLAAQRLGRSFGVIGLLAYIGFIAWQYGGVFLARGTP